jgi:hypothetical protein
MMTDELWMSLSEAQALQPLRAGGFALFFLTNKIEKIPYSMLDVRCSMFIF